MTTLDEQYGSGTTVPRQPASVAASRRRELADFLRSRRERIRPEQVGLPRGSRRRTPGLRREEVAQLSGLGLTWYTWLEQGRDINVSPQVLEAVARTLLLDRHERSHLFTLADSPLVSTGSECTAVTADVRVIVERLDPFPTSVTNARYDVLAWNSAYTKVSGDLEPLPVEDRNSLWLAFTSKRRRALLVDWDATVSRLVAQYRAAMADHLGEPAWKCLVQRLEQASPEFAAMWNRHEVGAPENLTKRLLHPSLGLLTFTHTSLWLGQATGVRLVTYVPADDVTRGVLNRLDELPRLAA